MHDLTTQYLYRKVVLPTWTHGRHLKPFLQFMNIPKAVRNLKRTKILKILDTDYSVAGRSTMPGYFYMDGYTSSDRCGHRDQGFPVGGSDSVVQLSAILLKFPRDGLGHFRYVRRGVKGYPRSQIVCKWILSDKAMRMRILTNPLLGYPRKNFL